MIVQTANPEIKEEVFACFLYEKGTGKPLLLKDPKEVERKLKEGFCDCPTKAKQSAEPAKKAVKAKG